MLHHTRFAVMVGLLALRVAQGTAAPASVTDDVSFSSRGQNLYSPADTGVDTHEIGFRVIDEKNELLRAGEIRTQPCQVAHNWSTEPVRRRTPDRSGTRVDQSCAAARRSMFS